MVRTLLWWVNFRRRARLLTTLLFIVGAYGLYALYTLWPRRHSGRSDFTSRALKRRRLLWGGLGLGTALGLWVMIWQIPSIQPRTFNLVSVLAAGQTGGWMADRDDRRLESLPIKSQLMGDQPVYTLLHPETPSTQEASEKKASRPAPSRRTKAGKPDGVVKKKGKTGSQVAKKEPATSSGKKESAPAQTRPKKKKPSPSPPAGAPSSRPESVG